MVSDTYILLEQLGHRLDRESERNFVEAQKMGLEGTEITKYIEDHINVANILKQAAPIWDGGYVLCVASLVAAKCLRFATRGASALLFGIKTTNCWWWLLSVR